eukprot:gb/GECG01009317.1/.p1 GENE.gb/GECG01009317.1/~~gb/GECG01009317.1/.p1  ORF type:complete len:291 (+),score=42.11 gb/GECG01009317.1/:1-873(+)
MRAFYDVHRTSAALILLVLVLSFPGEAPAATKGQKKARKTVNEEGLDDPLLEEDDLSDSNGGAYFDTEAIEGDFGRFTIEGKVEVPAAAERVLLNDHSVRESSINGAIRHDKQGFIASDGYFRIVNILPGNYTLEVDSHNIVYPDYKLELREDGTLSVVEYAYPGAPRVRKVHPIQIPAQTRVQYFKPREKWSLASLIMNPNTLMLGVIMFMAIGLPKMMENMDPEMLEEMQQQQSAMGGGDPMEMIKKMLSGEVQPPGAEQAQTQTTRPTVEPPRRGKTEKRKGRRPAA